MNKHSNKRRRRVDDDDGLGIITDGLSQFPEHILHHILSFLPQKDAVRTSVLSQSWRYLWHGRFNFELRDDDYRIFRNKEFWSFVDKTLQRYLDQNLSLHKFIVDIPSVAVDFALLRKWIPIVIMNMGVRSFNLIFHDSIISFSLPLVVFQSESLVEVHLQRCDLNTLKSTENVMFKNLQTLRLYYVKVTDELFEKIISSCPLIENLDLLECNGLKSIRLRKHFNIKNFACIMLDEIIIETENPQILESVSIRYSRDWFLRHRNMHFPHLKSLKLHRLQLPKMLDNFSPFFPCLNELILESCHGLKEFHLLSSSITRLIIKMYSNQGKRIKAFIDTPNIRYFEYLGHDFPPSIKFATTSNEWKSEINLFYRLEPSDKDATSWFLELNKLLKALSQSHITLRLLANNYEKLHINDSYGGFYIPVVVEHLKLWGCTYFDPALLNCFFKIFRPCYIQMENRLVIFNLVEYLSKLIPDETGCYLWLQELEEISTEVGNMEVNEWHWVQTTSFPALRSQQQIRFRLTWKEQLNKFT